MEIKICDPACGSGSFLLAAYDASIKSLSKEERKLVYLDSDGHVRLTSKIKRDILKSCIYGVDIDAQAVEVTKMSLSLKNLENTNHYEVHSERTLFHTTILPPLEGNIKCGNCLVETDIYDSELGFSETEYKKLNPFNWKNSSDYKINSHALFYELSTAIVKEQALIGFTSAIVIRKDT